MPQKTDWKHDAEYISYIESGESAAVFIVRDIAGAIDTNDKWIDVISFHAYSKKGAGERKAFNWIIVELFPRERAPQYSKKNTAYNKYLTWRIAHKDIAKQRHMGFQGQKYLILCNLYNQNKNKFTIRTVTGGKNKESQDADKPMKVKRELAPDWKYRIQVVREVNSEQVRYIEDHKWEIVNKIRKNGKPTLDMFDL